MKLGIISNYAEEDFRHVKDLGLEFIEICTNFDPESEEFIAKADETRRLIDKYELPVLSVGRWNANVIENNAINREIKYYLTKQNKYGLPLDCRKDYSKNDWIMWTAAMAKDEKTFLKFVDPVYDYINETNTRVPISDWYDTKTGLWQSFRARSVIGGFWMRVFADKLAAKK